MISSCPRSLGAALAPASEGCCSEYARVRVAENRRTAFRCASPLVFSNDWFSSRRVKMYRSHHQTKPASGWFCQSWFQLIVTECVFEHSSVPAPWWVFVAQLFGPPGGAIEAVQTPQFLRSGWLDNFHVLYHQKLSCAQTFLRHFHTFATVKFSGLDQFCTGLRPVSQTQRKERQREGGIVRPWYSDLWLRKRRPTWVGSVEEVLRNPGF